VSIENLGFEGGGVKGAAYAGALRALEQRGVLAGITRVAGASAGAITAMLVAMGATPAQIKEVVMATNWNKWKDTSLFEIHAVRVDFGLYKGNEMLSWLHAQATRFAGQPDPTFEDMKMDLRVVVSDMEMGSSLVLSRATTPKHSVPGAVRLSAGIPFFFECKPDPVDGHHYCDGGEYWNYPIDIFDFKDSDHSSTLGLKLAGPPPLLPAPVTIRNIKDYIGEHLNSLVDRANQIHVDPADAQRTIFIDSLGVSAVDFGISRQMLERLEASGYEATSKWLDTHGRAA
jgi:NTE family protein